MSNVSQWETSAPNNDAAPPHGAPEGMAANTVNDTMREMMAAVARWYQDTNGSLVTGGAGNAYTLSTNNNNSSLTDLPLVVFVANRANTGAATLNVDGLGAKSLRFGGVALAAGVIQEGVAYIAIYNAEDDAFDIVGYPTKDASEITTGTLPDARLSSNVARRNTSNTFTSTQTISTSSQFILDLRNTSAPANCGRWNVRIQTSDGALEVRAVDDDNLTLDIPIDLAHDDSGTTYISLTAPILDFNGNADISGTLAVGGAITGNGSGLTSLNASNLSSGTVPSDRLPSTIGGNKTFSNNVTVGGTISGNGSGLTNLNASNLSSGTVPDARLPATIGGNKTFSNNVTVGGTLEVGGAVRAGTVATSTSATLAAGQIHHRSSNTTVPSMNAGQWVAVQNTSTSSITLSQGSGVTLELGGTTMTGNRTLLPKGFAFIYFRANGVGVVHGSGVT